MPKIISIQVVDRKVETRDGVESYETIYGLGEDSKIYIWDEVEAGRTLPLDRYTQNTFLVA